MLRPGSGRAITRTTGIGQSAVSGRVTVCKLTITHKTFGKQTNMVLKREVIIPLPTYESQSQWYVTVFPLSVLP